MGWNTKPAINTGVRHTCLTGKNKQTLEIQITVWLNARF